MRFLASAHPIVLPHPPFALSLWFDKLTMIGGRTFPLPFPSITHHLRFACLCFDKALLMVR
jgi:hypothetical protein